MTPGSPQKRSFPVAILCARAGLARVRCQMRAVNIGPHALCAGSALCVPRQAQGSKILVPSSSAGCGECVSCLQGRAASVSHRLRLRAKISC